MDAVRIPDPRAPRAGDRFVGRPDKGIIEILWAEYDHFLAQHPDFPVPTVHNRLAAAMWIPAPPVPEFKYVILGNDGQLDFGDTLPPETHVHFVIACELPWRWKL